MKSLFCLHLILCWTYIVTAQRFDWTTGIESSITPPGISTGSNQQSHVATDPSGDIIVCGVFSDTLLLNNDTLFSYGFSDFYFAKLDTAGNYLWIQGVGSTHMDNVYNMSVDGSGNIYVSTSNNFGLSIFTADSVVNLAGSYYNVLCFDNDGFFKWIRTGFPTFGSTIYLASQANVAGVYVAYSGTIHKIDEDGVDVWSEVPSAGPASPLFTAISVSENGFLAMAFAMVSLNTVQGTFIFDTLSVSYTNSATSKLIVLADTSGAGLWGNDITENTISNVPVSTIAIDNSTGAGAVYAGITGSGAPFYFANDTVVNPVNASDGFGAVLKYHISGAKQWARPIYSAGISITDLIVNNTGDVVFAANYNGSYCYFDTLSLATGGTNPVIAKLTSSGNYSWAKIDDRNVNNSTVDNSFNVAIIPGNRYVVGSAWYDFFSNLNPYYQGCNIYTPSAYPSGFIFTAISENTEFSAVITSTTDASCSTCSDGSASGTASFGIPPYTYTWSPSGGNLSTALNLLPGLYTFCATDASGCTVCDTVTVNFASSISEQTSNAIFTIYPNPALSSFTVSLHDGSNLKNLELEITDITGRKVYHQPLLVPSTTLDLQICSGVYIVNLKSDRGINSSRLVKE